jgi:drug/metabolite transporter (DMT)-like permease
VSAAALPWLWVPVVLGAALAQTARNAAQRSLVAQAGTLGATLARFLYGVPFAALCVAALHGWMGDAAPLPAFSSTWFGWLLVGAVSQIAATAFLLAAMKQRNFVIGVAYSKTDALQVALFGVLLLREWPAWATMVAMALATAGVVLLSLPRKPGELATAQGWTGTAALWGLASGAGFALSAVGYRGAALELPGSSAWIVGAWGVLCAQVVQTLLLGGWLAWRSPQALRAITTAWRVSTVAGSMGALASLGWFTAFAMTTAANVRTLGLAEVVFSYLVSRRVMQEKLAPIETAGLVLVVVGLLAMFAGL